MASSSTTPSIAPSIPSTGPYGRGKNHAPVASTAAIPATAST